MFAQSNAESRRAAAAAGRGVTGQRNIKIASWPQRGCGLSEGPSTDTSIEQQNRIRNTGSESLRPGADRADTRRHSGLRAGARLAVAAAPLTFVAPATAAISSTFDEDTEGWSTVNDAESFTHTLALGNPPGAIRATDRGNGIVWYFAAPGVYLGDKSAFTGGRLSWDILGIANNQTTLPAPADVILEGAGFRIGIDAGVQPVIGAWTSWSVDLLAGDWRFITDARNGALSSDIVTDTVFSAVLAELTGLYIRGEYSSFSGDSAALDNVRLSAVPTPGPASVFGLTALAGLRRRRGIGIGLAANTAPQPQR